MQGDRWLAGLAAGLAMGVLLVGLWLTATRSPARLEPQPRAAPELGTVCVTTHLICAAPAMPLGYPCTCTDPLRGVSSGEVMSMAKVPLTSGQLRGRSDPAPEEDAEDDDEGRFFGP
jgi:hypothetical protein